MRQIFALILVLASVTCRSSQVPAVKEGDIIFQTSLSSQSVAIQRATNSPYSHMGIVFLQDGKPFVFEAISTVRYTPLAKWVARGKGGRYVLKRLIDSSTQLTPVAIARLRSTARSFEGKPYDLTFEWSDRRIYCSELVWKIYQRALGIEIGQQQRLVDFKLDDPAVRAKMRERYGDQIPFNEPVVSPAAMFESKLLQVVAQR